MSIWTDTLKKLGFTMPADAPACLENRDPAITPQLIDLSHWALLRISGVDATDFLQGQLSNDITLLSVEQPHQLTGYCNPKGRLFAIFHVIKRENDYLFAAPRAVVGKVMPRLRMFVMRAEVKIEEETSTVLCAASRELQTPDDVHTALIKALPDFQFITASPQAMTNFWQAQNNVDLGDYRDWQALEILNGLPQIEEENIEKLIPQQVNLDLVEGVNFKKGCYPGQEIIARIRYLGKPKSRLIPVRASTPISVGAAIYQGDNPAGNVAQSTLTRNGEPLLSAAVASKYLGNDFPLSIENQLLERLPHAYEIPSSSQ